VEIFGLGEAQELGVHHVGSIGVASIVESNDTFHVLLSKSIVLKSVLYHV